MAKLSTKDRQGLALIAGVLVLVAGLFVANYTVSQKVELDERNCAMPVLRKTAIVIDRSDDTPTQTITEMVARVKKYAEEGAEQNELISLFEISSATRTDLKPVFSACLPQKDGNDIYENRKRIHKYFDEQFARPLDAALARPPRVSESSPISEAIIDLAASSYLDAPTNRLIVFSDLMQNSDNTSLYSCDAAPSAIASFRAHRAGAIERPTFHNTAIELHVIPREGLGAAAVACRDGFWTWFLGDNSGKNAGIEPKALPGGARVS